MRRIRSYSGAGVMLFRYSLEAGQFEVLLGKRSTRRGYNKWAIPGGHKERYDADFRACAFREFREETGIDIRALQTQDIAETCTDIPFFHWRTFLVMTWGDLPNFSIREFSELKWIPVSEIRNYDMWIGLNREMRVFKKLVVKQDRNNCAVTRKGSRTGGMLSLE